MNPVDEMIRFVVTQAFQHGALIDKPADHPLIAEVIQRHDFIAAVWVDPVAGGFACLTVKGADHMTNPTRDVTMSAIPTFDHAGALALQAMYGTAADAAWNPPATQRPALQ